MKYILTLCFTVMLIACGTTSLSNTYPEATNSLDAGRYFIDACLKGDFEKAKYYMLPDAENQKQLLQLERAYREKDRDGRQQYREASINIAEIANLSETITIINYSNTYDKVGHKIKVVMEGNKWLVDFKYTFNPNL